MIVEGGINVQEVQQVNISNEHTIDTLESMGIQRYPGAPPVKLTSEENAAYLRTQNGKMSQHIANTLTPHGQGNVPLRSIVHDPYNVIVSSYIR
jgi:hypothetical protein